MTEQNGLSAILAEQAPSQPDAGNTAAQPVAATQQEISGEPAKAEKQEAPPAPEKAKTDKSEADKAFATLKREIKALKHQLANQHARPEPQKPVDPLTDPDGFAQRVDSNIVQAQQFAKLEVFEALAAEKYEDFQDMMDVFTEHAQGNPALVGEMLRATNPAEYAYQYGKQQKMRAEIGDPVQYGEKMKEEGRKAALAEMQPLIDAKIKEALGQMLPKSLAETQTQGGRVTNPNGYNGPTPIGDILNRK